MDSIICEILDYTTPEELMFDCENTDLEFMADVVRDVVFFDGSVSTREIYEALCEFVRQNDAAA